MSVALELRAVSKCYRAGDGSCVAAAIALRDVRLTVHRGEVVAVIGAPGSGRSTLLLCSAGLLRPDSGEIRWFEESDRALAVRRARFHYAGDDLAQRLEWSGLSRESLLHLIDARPLRSPAAPLPRPECVRRVAHWIERRRAAGDAVVLAGDDEAGVPFATRVVVMRAGRILASSMQHASAPLHIRVAEPTR